MLWLIVALVVILLLIRLVWNLIERFWAWLGKGRTLERIEALRESGGNAKFEALAESQERVEEAHAVVKEARKERRLTKEELREVFAAETNARRVFMQNLKIGWYQVVMLFFLGSILGLIIEEVWMYITAGLTESRVGLVWGPFSPLYGTGAVLLTIICYAITKKGAEWWLIFLLSMAVGGLLEQIVGWSMETFMGAVSWDYSAVPGCITKWVAVPFLFFWGLLGLIWSKLIMPDLLYRIGEPTTRRQVIFVALLAAYLAADIFMTLACFDRVHDRERGIPPRGPFEEWVDENYGDDFVESHFENMAFDTPET